MWEANRISQEEPATSSGLVKICIVALLGFGGMALMGEDTHRAPTLLIGGSALAAVATYGLWLRSQRRYGSATLEAREPFQYGRTFSGVVHTELQTAGSGAIRVRVSAGNRTARNRGDYFAVKQTVPQTHLQRSTSGHVRIPFSVQIPAHVPHAHDEARLTVRTSSWPIGWGAAFVVASGYVPILDDIISD